jgi:hypothetical protein
VHVPSAYIDQLADQDPQSLLTPFAYIIYHQRDAVLGTLEGMSVEGQSGLAVFANKWCEQPGYQGLWATRINTLALAHVVAADRPSLRELHVRGEMIEQPGSERGEQLPPRHVLYLCARYDRSAADGGQ